VAVHNGGNLAVTTKATRSALTEFVALRCLDLNLGHGVFS
jgi:hypothetical protein